MALLNKIVKRTFDNQQEKFYGNASYLQDIDQLNASPQDIKPKNNDKDEIVEVIPHKQLSLDEKLSLINARVDKLNTKGDSIYVAKPILDNVNMPDQVPVIILAVKIACCFCDKNNAYASHFANVINAIF